MPNKPKLWSRDFVLLANANLLMAIAFYFMMPILPVYLTDKLAASKSEVGMVLAFYTIATLIIRLFSGWTIDTYGRKTIYLFAYLFFSIFFIGYPLAFTIYLFIGIRFLHGLTWGVLTTSSSTIAVDIIPPSRRGEGIGIFGLSMTIGMAIGPMIAIFITGTDRYTMLFISAIGISFLGFLLAQFVSYPRFNIKNSKRAFSFKGLIEKNSIPVSINMMIVQFTYGGVISFIALYGKEIGVESSGLFFLILSIGIGLSRVNSGRIFDVSGPNRIILLGMVLLVLGFPALAIFDNSLGFHLSAIVLGLGFGIIMPTFQAMVNNLVSPSRRGAANSTFFTSFDIGIGLGMVGTGILSDYLGFSRTFLIFSAIIIMALIFFLLISIRHYKEKLPVMLS
jgi:predicted MFS family arabinose efflux permease